MKVTVESDKSVEDVWFEVVKLTHTRGGPLVVLYKINGERYSAACNEGTFNIPGVVSLTIEAEE